MDIDTLTERVRYKRKELEVGDQIILISNIENGLLKLNVFDEGAIIYLQNQVKATIWFRHVGKNYKDPITEALQLDTSYSKNGKLDGITVELKRESFAIKHRYSEGFTGLVVDEDKALTIPFFYHSEEHRMPSNTSRNNGRGVFEPIYQYYLNDIIDNIVDNFDKWVSMTIKTRRIKKSEKENGDYPDHWDTCLTDESNNLFYQKKQAIELAFAKSTGVYYEFTGGLLFD